MKQWFRVSASVADPTTVDIHIIDFIGDWMDDAINRIWGEQIGITARAFVDELAKLPENVKALRVHINSPGGDVQGAVNIANALREQQTSKGRTVETIVDGLAASAASIIAMAGSKVTMADNALLMIHNAWTIAVGNAADMRKTADVLDAVKSQIISTYQWHSELSDAEISALMDAETWMDADEAITNGFATDKIAGIAVAASINPKSLAKLKIPEKFQARVQKFVAPKTETPSPAKAEDVLRLCKESECLDLAEGFVAKKATLDEVNASLATEKQTRTAAKARNEEIRALCIAAKFPEQAEGYIASNMPMPAIKAQLTGLSAKFDRTEIDNGLHPDQIKANTATGWKKAMTRAQRSPFGARH